MGSAYAGQSIPYDQSGRLTNRTDARRIRASYGYDVLNRVTTVTHPNGAISYIYDAADRSMVVADPTGSTTYAFDALSA